MITLNHLHYLANVKRVKNLKSVTISFSEVETTFDVYFTDDEFDYMFDAHVTAGYGGIIWVYNYERAYKLEDLVPKGDSFMQFYQDIIDVVDIEGVVKFIKMLKLPNYKHTDKTYDLAMIKLMVKSFSEFIMRVEEGVSKTITSNFRFVLFNNSANGILEHLPSNRQEIISSWTQFCNSIKEVSSGYKKKDLIKKKWLVLNASIEKLNALKC